MLRLAARLALLPWRHRSFSSSPKENRVVVPARDPGGVEPGEEVRNRPVIGHAGVLVAEAQEPASSCNIRSNGHAAHSRCTFCECKDGQRPTRVRFGGTGKPRSSCCGSFKAVT
jgi:hypothetical protein